MSKLPRPSGKALIAVLERAGYRVLRVRGSHHFLQHPNGRSPVVPIHSGETIGPGLLKKILADCNMTAVELVELL
jgi:predicted RNA binding protein YcfA (HicA-like mRNA interferase family)